MCALCFDNENKARGGKKMCANIADKSESETQVNKHVSWLGQKSERERENALYNQVARQLI